jgi:uncharacterized protein (TIGR02145 family)
MQSIKAIGMVLLATVLTPFTYAQTVDIKGFVKDAAGAGIAGVTVRLEKAAFAAVSGADGRFAINDKSTGMPRGPAALPSRLSASVDKGSLWVQLPETAEVTVTAFGMDGVALSTSRFKMDPGANAIPLPHRGQGLVFYRIKAGGHEVMTRSLTLSVAGNASVVPGSTVPGFVNNVRAASAKAAATTTIAAGFKDILTAGKTGFLTHRSTVVTPTAAGVEIKMIASAGALKDADGNEYQTVKIGNQTWTAEHWRSTKYADGSAIPLVQDKAGWANKTTPAYCSYNGMANPDSLKRFGLLYNWHVINTKKLAPEGWRVPGDADWTALQNALISGGFNFDGTTSGNKVGKAMAGMTDWATAAKTGAVGNDMAKNNKSGFGGVPTGFRDQGGNFTSMGSRCIMSASSNKEGQFGWFADLDAASETLRYSDDWMSMGFLVRFVKN